MNPCRILTLLAAVLLVTPAIAADYYVSLSGKDTNAGTLAAPWRTIQKAASSVPAGSIVNIRSGTYNEMVQITVSGKSGARIVFQSAPGEQAKIDGTGLKLPLHEAPLIRLTDRDYVTIQNLELCNVTTTDDKTMPMGIFIDSSGVGIEIRNCKIHDILQNNTKKNNFNANAHGIGAYGSSPTGISALVIDGCEVYNLHLGASESIAPKVRARKRGKSAHSMGLTQDSEGVFATNGRKSGL